MTTSDEQIMMVEYLKHLGIIGQACGETCGKDCGEACGGDGCEIETARDLAAYECLRCIIEALLWESDLRAEGVGAWVTTTFYAIRKQAEEHWRRTHGSWRVSSEIWGRHARATRELATEGVNVRQVLAEIEDGG